jgi:signal transduction histidine kinase/ActR/RegA family two-component response regulator
MRLPALRSHLLLLTLGSMVPLIVLIVLIAALLFEREENLARDGALARMKATASAVDALLLGHLSSLRALGSSDALAHADLAGFERDALRVKATQVHWRNVILVDAAGQQRMNLRLGAQRPLPQERETERPGLLQVLQTGEAHVGNVGRGPASGFVAIPLQIRVSMGGEPMSLKLILEPEAFAALLSQQRVPPGWAVAIVDGNGHFVARQPHRPPGTRASEPLLQAMGQADSGWRRVPTLEGRDTHQAFAAMPSAPWRVAVAVPREEVLAGVHRAGRWLAWGALISLGIAGGLALWVSRRIAAPIHLLARAAQRVGEADTAALRDVQRQPGFAEAAEVARALEEAAASIREREALRQREQLAMREADRAKDEFLAMLGHELRNPLSAITNSAHVLRRAPAGAGSAERAHEVIERQTRQMTRLVEDLLDISRLATGKLRLELELQDLHGVVGSAIATWQHNATRQGKAVRFEGEPAWARLDRSRLEQILGNLVDNALKFSPPGGTVDVRVAAEGAHAVLRVHDAGRGIRTDDLPRVFDTFYQATQLMHRPQGGMGLGLSLVRRLAELHGGSAEATSAGEGQGACFTIRLPLAAPPQVASAPDADGDAVAGPRRRVLVVEDNEDGRAVLELMLQLASHEVRGAADGAGALAILAQWRPDVALIDIGLPDIDGHELARRIAAALPPGSRPRLVAMSGFGQPEDQQRSAAAGFEVHLTKPVDPALLARVLQGSALSATATG